MFYENIQILAFQHNTDLFMLDERVNTWSAFTVIIKLLCLIRLKNCYIKLRLRVWYSKKS